MRHAARLVHGLIPLALFWLLAVPSALTGQEALRYTTTSIFEMGGMIGTLMSAFSDAGDPVEETVTVGGGMMRTDSDEETTIMNLSEGRMIQIDHGARTWWAFDFETAFEEISEIREESVADLEREMDEADTEEIPEFTGSFDVDRTGRTQRFDGRQAEQVLFTLTMEAREDEDSPLAARMVLLSEMWMSPELSAHPAFTAMNREAANFVAEEFGSGMGMGGIGMADPRMADALGRMESELEGLEGMAVRTTSLFVLLPGDLEFDREAAIASLDEELSADGPSLADLASGGADAARSALGGLFGRRSEPEEEEAPEPTQQSLMRMIQEIRDVRDVDFDPSMFSPPADYTEVESPLAGMRR